MLGQLKGTVSQDSNQLTRTFLWSLKTKKFFEQLTAIIFTDADKTKNISFFHYLSGKLIWKQSCDTVPLFDQMINNLNGFKTT
jgi:hypothetical protein